MKRYMRLFTLLAVFLTVFVLASCSKTAENEHLPEYCRTYSGFIEFASLDLYEEVGGINRFDYLSVISRNELTIRADEEDGEFDLSGIQCFQNLTSLSLEGKGIKDISQISALKNIQEISLVSTNVVDISSFKNLSKVKSLTISDTKTLQSVTGVEEMTKLKDLDLSDNGIVNIDGLNNLVNLESLNLSNNEIRFFPSINQLENLEALDVSNNNIIQLGDDLSGLRNLLEFNASQNQICDISTLDDLTNIVNLDLSENDLGCNGTSPDFSGLDGATRLTELKLNDNNLTSIEDLRGRNLPLEELHLENNLLTDLSPIADYTTIEELFIFNNNISDISELTGMTNITQIDLSENLIVDFSNLRSIPDLEKIDLSDNAITFIPDISDSWPSLRELDLENNALNDTSGVKGHPNLRTLIINNNGLNSLSGISDLPLLDEIIMYREPQEGLEEEFIPEDSPNLITIIDDSFNNVPNLVIDVDGELLLEYEFGFNVQILGSFNNNDDIQIVDLSEMNIDVIDEFSFNLENLEGIYVQDNNISDISFILGNPELRQIDISNNPVANLTIINGTATEDLDNLEQVRARGITGENHLDGAFVDLPDINFIDLTDTRIDTISSSFNDLDEVTTLTFEGEFLVSVDNSFNNIFAVYNNENDIALDGGLLEFITGSFNNGLYDSIVITNNNPAVLGATNITNSFNNIEANNVQSIVISGNTFETIDNSFNTVTCDNLFLANNYTHVVTNSFTDTSIAVELNLQNNELSTVDLSGILTVDTIDLSNNALTTVAFLDSIPDLTTLDISAQFTEDNLTITLNTIDGINNMTGLDSITMDELGFTSIDGFKDVGITTFNYTTLENNGIQVTDITAQSFENSLITTLNLNGHTLTNIDFLNNFASLTTLNISTNMADLTPITTMPFEADLVDLSLGNIQPIPDFTILSEYDSVFNLELDIPNNTEILNFNGMDSLNNVLFTNIDSITHIDTSFNDLDSLNITPTYLSNFSNVTNIDNSFDIYGLNGLNQSVTLDGSLTIVDSFNNVINVTINNGVETAPNYDGDSFDAVTDLTLTNPEYISYVFVTSYVTLDTFVIETLPVNITDLNNATITSFEIEGVTNSVNTLSYTVNDAAVLDLSSGTFGGITISSNHTDYNFDADFANMTINGTNTTLNIQGTPANLVVNGVDITDINFVSFNSGNGTLNTDNLVNVTSNAQSGSDFSTLDVNSNEAIMSVDVRADVLNMNTANVSDLTLDGNNNVVTVDTDVTNMILDADSDTVYFTNHTLESLTASGSVGDLYVQSDNVDTVNLGTTTITNLFVTSTVTNLSVTGSDVTTSNIINHSMTTGTLSLSGSDISLNNNVNNAVSLTVISDTLTVNGNNITGITFDNTSDINDFTMSNGNQIGSLVFGTSTIDTVDLTSSEAIFSLSGTHSMDVTLTMNNLNDLTLDSVNSDYSIFTNQVSLTSNLQANDVVLDGVVNLNTITIDTTSAMNDFSIINSSSVNNLTFGDATINTVALSSSNTVFSLNGVNVNSLDLSGDNFIDVTVNVSNDFTFNSNYTGLTSMDLTATTATLNTESSILSIDNDSVIGTLDLTNNNLSSLVLGSADVTDVDINSTNNTLTVASTGLSTLDLATSTNTIDLTVPLEATVTVNSGAIGTTTIDTTTSDIDVTASNNVILNSSTLDNVIVNVGNGDVTLNLDKASLVLDLLSISDTTVIDSASMSSLNLAVSSDISTLTLPNSTLTSLDLTNLNVDVVNVFSDGATFTLTSNNLTNGNLYVDNASNVTVNAASTDIYLSTAYNSAFDIDGSVADFTLVADDITSMDMADFSASSLIMDITSVNILDTVTHTGDLQIDSASADFDLITNAAILRYISLSNNDLSITSTATSMEVNSDTNVLNFDAVNTDFTITGLVNNSFNGVVDEINIGNSVFSANLSFDLDATSITVDNNFSSQLLLSGTRTVDTLTVNSTSIDTINTNEVTLSNMFPNTDSANLSIDTAAGAVNLGQDQTGAVTINVRKNSMSVSTYSTDVTLNTTNLSGATLTINGSNNVDIDINNLNNAIINLSGAVNQSRTANLEIDVVEDILMNSNLVTDINFTGTMQDLTIQSGEELESLVTTNLTVTNELDVSDTGLVLASFASANLLANVNVVRLPDFTVDTATLDDFLDTFDGTAITVFTNITQQDIIDHIKAEHVATLTATEAITNARFDAIYNPLVDDALATFRLNTNFDYITNDQDLIDQIEAQTYDTVATFLEGYALDQGYTGDGDQVTPVDEMRTDLGDPTVDAIETSMINTLNDASLVIDTNAIDTQVTADIDAEAEAQAIIDEGNKGFTLG